MQKRVKALNERREQLKAGIVSNAPKSAQIVRRSDTTDAIRSILNKLKVLQDSQLADAQQSWRRAGSATRNGRLSSLAAWLLPIVLGGLAAVVIY
jgi:tight adherence protein C